jgi:hypothetical protein
MYARKTDAQRAQVRGRSERRELRRHACRIQLKHVLRLAEAAQVVRAQIAELRSRWQTRADHRVGVARQQRLATRSNRSQPRAAVYRCPVIIGITQIGFAGVQRDAHAQLRLWRPLLARQVRLDSYGRGRGVRRARNTAKRLSPSPRGRTTTPPWRSTQLSMIAS